MHVLCTSGLWLLARSLRSAIIAAIAWCQSFSMVPHVTLNRGPSEGRS